MTEALIIETLTAVGVLFGSLALLVAIFLGMFDD